MDNLNNNQNQPVQPYQQFVPQYQYVQPVKKQYEPLEKRDSRFVTVFFICTALFTDFALFKGFHLGFTIAYALLFGVSTVYLWNKEAKLKAFPLICGVISLAGCVTLSLFDNEFVNAIMLILTAGLFTLYCLGISGAFKRSHGSFKMLFDLAEGAVTKPLENLSDVFGSVKAGAKKGSKNLSAIIGILLSVPVLFVIVPLLVSSDAAFEGLVNSVIKNIGIYLAELAVAVLITPFVFSYMFGKRHVLSAKNGEAKREVKRTFPVSGSVSFLSIISLVYVVYLFSQLAYFFSAFKGILPEGYKYNASVFARRGFFEMFAVVAINIALISAVSAFTKRKNGNVSAGIKGISLFISLFSVLMLAIAMQKMRLNIATFGYSRNRLMVCAFMLMMLIVIAFFILHIFAPKVPYMQVIIVSCSIIFVVLSFADINLMTAEYNTAAYTDGRLKGVNVEYLAELGDSTVPSLIKLTKSEDNKTAARARIALAKYAADSKLFTSGKDNKLIYHPMDFRSYVRVSDKSAKALSEYYDSLDAGEKENFTKAFKRFKKYDFTYCKDSDAYENWEYDEGYKYNAKTGEFEYVNKLQ